MSDAFSVAGQVAVVTGAASGIGRATALALASAGARIAGGDLDESGLEATAAQVRDTVPDAETLWLRGDVSVRSDVETLVQRAVSMWGRIDAMANVAGILHRSPVVDTQEDALDRVLSVNLKGTFFGCQAAVPVMREAGGGSIVNIASSAAVAPSPTLAAYAMSKAGVLALTRVLAAEVAAFGIRVNAVAPGMVDTPMALAGARREDGSVDPERREELLRTVRERIPLGIEGRPRDIALGVLYLCSPAARYMTGQVLHLNGGVPMV